MGWGQGAYFGENLVTDLPAKQTALEGEGVAENAAFLRARTPSPSIPSCPALLLPGLLETALKTPAYTQQGGLI